MVNCAAHLALVAFFVASVAAQQGPVNITPCADPGKGQMKGLLATPCESDPCEFSKGTTVEFGFEYVSETDSATLRLEATVNVFGVKVPVPGLEGNLCKSVIECPVRMGDDIVGSFKMPIANMPISQTTVEVQIRNDNGVSACFTFPAILR